MCKGLHSYGHSIASGLVHCLLSNKSFLFMVIIWTTFEIYFLLIFFYLYTVLTLHKFVLSCSLCYLGQFESRITCADDDG